MEGKELEVGPFLPTPFAFLGHLMTGIPLSGHREPQDIPMLFQGA